jgi:hypothetical protein
MEIEPSKETETAEREARRTRLLEFLSSDEPAWRDEDHPDIVALGTAEWVHRSRNQISPREKSIEEHFSDG